MHIEDFKTWHWMVLGPIIGLIFGCVILYQGTSADRPGMDTLDQGRFERAVTGLTGRTKEENLISRYSNDLMAKGIPEVVDLVVHPPLLEDAEHKYWVTGGVLMIAEEHADPKDPSSKMVARPHYRRFRFPARVPYRAVLGEPGAYSTVLEYLNALKKKPSDVNLSYSYAWWDGTPATLMNTALAGLLVIGFAWPLAIHVMQGAGLAKLPEPKKVKLPKSKKVLAKTAADRATDDARLDDLNAQLEAGLAAGASSGGGTAIAEASTEAPVKTLTGGPATDPASVAAAAAEQERLIREYGGEFYPVVKPVHKEPEKLENKAK